MPKYTVSEVIDIFQSLTAEEKLEFQKSLGVLLGSVEKASDFLPTRSQNLQMTGINISRSHMIELSQNATEEILQSSDLEPISEALQKLRQELGNSTFLNATDKKAIEISIGSLEGELKKSKLDKNFIDQAITTLTKSLSGVESLAAPVKKVADLVANAWVS